MTLKRLLTGKPGNLLEFCELAKSEGKEAVSLGVQIRETMLGSNGHSNGHAKDFVPADIYVSYEDGANRIRVAKFKDVLGISSSIEEIEQYLGKEFIVKRRYN